MTEPIEFAKVVWRPEDIMDLRIGMTRDQAITFLERNAKYIQEAMVDRGWDAIDTLLGMEDIE